MAQSGPITSGRSWREQQDRRDELAEERRPRAWTGYKVGPESGLTPLELEALRRTGQLAE